MKSKLGLFYENGARYSVHRVERCIGRQNKIRYGNFSGYRDDNRLHSHPIIPDNTANGLIEFGATELVDYAHLHTFVVP